MRSPFNILNEIATEAAQIGLERDLEENISNRIELLKENKYEQDFYFGKLGKTELEFSSVLYRTRDDKSKYILGVEFPSFYALWIENQSINENEALSRYETLCDKISKKHYEIKISKDGRLNFIVDLKKM